MVKYLDLNHEVSQMFLECWDVLIEVKQPLNSHFNLSTGEWKGKRELALEEAKKKKRLARLWECSQSGEQNNQIFFCMRTDLNSQERMSFVLSPRLAAFTSYARGLLRTCQKGKRRKSNEQSHA